MDAQANIGWLLFLVALTTTGCAHTAPPPVVPLRVRLPDIGTLPAHPSSVERPLIVEIHEGEALPLDVTIEGDLLASPQPPQPIPLVAKRNFFIRIDRDGLSVSRDGVHFGVRGRTPGSFAVGMSVTRERGARGEIRIRTPTP